MSGFSSPDDDDSTEYTVTEIQVEVSRRKQLEEYEPFEVSERITAVVSVDDTDEADEISEELSDLAKEHVQREIVKRVHEQEMMAELEGDD